MKKLLFFIVSLIFCYGSFAQKAYFLYLQTEDQAPFYVRMNNKVFSSAASGYLILPNLTDSIYKLSIGFAKSQVPESKFAVAIKQNDKGYLIKKFNEDIALFDIGELTLLKPGTEVVEAVAYEVKSDKFSSILSKAADDPSLLKVAVQKKDAEEKKSDNVKVVEQSKTEEPVVKKEDVFIPIDSAKAVDQSLEKDTVLDQEAGRPIDTVAKKIIDVEEIANEITTPEYKPSIVIRYAESSTTEGFGLVYFDKQETKTDTIRILIKPSSAKNLLENQSKVNAISEQQQEVEKIASVDTQSVEAVISLQANAGINQNCKAIASEKDFMKLRKNMAARNGEDEMLNEAKKHFRNKCFSVEQLRNLSALFLTSSSRYQFFDAAFIATADQQNFRLLQSEIKDDYYLKRFKAILGE